MEVNYNYIRSHTDYTNLSPTATRKDIDILCKRAINYKVASVCVAPCWVAYIRKTYPELHICTVIGFPNGYSTTAVKYFETKDAISNGADEIDMVVNQNWVCGSEADLERAAAEIEEILSCCRKESKVLKVIFETCNLSRNQIFRLSCICSNLGVDYVKTSTGFGKAGASPYIVSDMKKDAAPCKVKAAGGIRTIKDATDYLIEFSNAIQKYRKMCDRIGASSTEIIELKEGELVHILTTNYGRKKVDVKGIVSHKYGESFMLQDVNDPDVWYSICDFEDTFEVITK